MSEVVNKSFNPTATDKKERSFGRVVAGITVGYFGYYMATIVPTALLLALKMNQIDPKNVTADFSLVTGIGAIIGVVANYIGGIISDHTRVSFGKRRTWILIGAILGAVFLFGVGIATTVKSVVLLWCITTIFYSFSGAANAALVPEQIDEPRRGTAGGIIGIFNPIAITLGLALMTMINSLPIAYKFLFLSVISIVTAIIDCMLIKEDPHQQSAPKQKEEKRSFGETISRLYPNPRKYPAFSWGILTRFLVCTAYASQVFLTLYFMKKFNIPEEQVSSIVTITNLISTVGLVISSLLGGVLSDKFRKQKPFVAISAVVVAIAVFSMAFAPSLKIVYVAEFILGLGYGAYIAVDVALMSRLLPNPEDTAKDMGIVNIAGVLPQSIVPTFSNALISAGGFPLFYGVLACAGILSALAVAPIPEMSPKPVGD